MNNNLIVVVLISVLLSSCSHVLNKGLSDSQIFSAQRNPKLERIDAWRIEGLIKIRKKNQSGVLMLTWTNNNNRHNLKLVAPLGKTIFELALKDSKARITLKNGKTYQSNNAEQLIKQLVGLDVPIDPLTLWVKGQTSAKRNTFDNQGRLALSTIDNWKLTIEEYIWAENKYFGDIEMPSVLKIEKNDIVLLLQIRQWNINDSQPVINFNDDFQSIPLFVL